MTYSKWTPARMQSFIVSALRSATRRYPPKYEAKDFAKTERRINPKSGKLAQFYQCAVCNEEFTSTNIEIDHIVPVVDPAKGFEDWNTYIPRLFCDPENFQALCHGCHVEKTKLEKGTTNENRRTRKK